MIDMGKAGVGSLIFRLRDDHDLTTQELADRADVSIADVEELERGEWSGCDMAVVERIGLFFGLTSLEMFTKSQKISLELEEVWRGKRT